MKNIFRRAALAYRRAVRWSEEPYFDTFVESLSVAEITAIQDELANKLDTTILHNLIRKYRYGPTFEELRVEASRLRIKYYGNLTKEQLEIAIGRAKETNKEI